MSAEARIKEMHIEMREATTRYMNILCKTEAGEPFDFTDYDVQTWVAFGANEIYVPNTIVENLLSYRIPPEVSLARRSGVAETRIFKAGDVFEVLRVVISVNSAGKPDLEPHEPTGAETEG